MAQQKQQQQQQQKQKQKQHRRQQQDDDDDCDESKCVSTGKNWEFNNSYTCYSNDDVDGWYYPMMCADGYKPRIVESEPTVFDYFEDPYKYFTCCPPKLSTETNVSRHCSDPTTTFYESFEAINETNNNSNSNSNNNSTSMLCDYDDARPYPRQMKTSIDYSYNTEVESYVCCDSAENTNFLDEMECVPYRNQFYERLERNWYGQLEVITCNFRDFQFPRLMSTNNNSEYEYEYECCKTGSKQPFLQDNAFKATVYPQIVISSIAVVSCIIVILSLSIPLLMQLKNGTAKMTRRTSRISRSSQTLRSSGRSRSSQILRSSGRSRGSISAESEYSTYNLYLVYLAIPDLILNLYLLGMYGSYANQKFNPNFYGIIIEDYNRNYYAVPSFEGAFVVACSAANLFLNAVISSEVFILLRNCYHVRRCNPPSLLKATFNRSYQCAWQ